MRVVPNLLINPYISVENPSKRGFLRMGLKESQELFSLRLWGVDSAFKIVILTGFKILFLGPCPELSTEPYVHYEIVKPGKNPNVTFYQGTVVRVICARGYKLNIGTNNTAKCSRSRWKPEKPDCNISECRGVSRGLILGAPLNFFSNFVQKFLLTKVVQ